MKKLMALVLAAMLLLVCCSAVAEAPEGYPEIKEGIDFGGKERCTGKLPLRVDCIHRLEFGDRKSVV